MQLTCSNLSVSFDAGGTRVEALCDISFRAQSGEFLSIVGPSGCGKTTLLRALAGLVSVQRGGVDYDAAGVGGKHRVLLVFQEDGLFPWMTVMENATFGLEIGGVAREEREAKAGQLLARFGLAGRERSYPHELSLGMKQRVAVIRSFLSNPGALLMDEPFAALDAQTRLKLQQELLALWQQSGTTVVFVTHDVDEAILLSDRILVLSPQPGTVMAQYQVTLERPRSPAGSLDAEFLALKSRLLSDLGLTQEDAVRVR